MPANRFFLDHPLLQENRAHLQGTEAHHLTKVMRKSRGAIVELIDGHGKLATAEVLAVGRELVELKILSLTESEKPERRILCQAIPRLNRLETILEKGTELGMTELWLFPGELSEKTSLTKNQIERIHTLFVSALKQCGRLYLPLLELKPSLLEWKELPLQSFFGDIAPDAPPFPQKLRHEPILFCVGPEAGFTPKEEEKLRKLGAQGVALSHAILRTDTAPLVALSLIEFLIRA
ncbi:MAG: RsmE family RNA methyltransferase [Chlamydiales bacterium]